MMYPWSSFKTGPYSSTDHYKIDSQVVVPLFNLFRPGNMFRNWCLCIIYSVTGSVVFFVLVQYFTKFSVVAVQHAPKKWIHSYLNEWSKSSKINGKCGQLHKKCLKTVKYILVKNQIIRSKYNELNVIEISRFFCRKRSIRSRSDRKSTKQGSSLWNLLTMAKEGGGSGGVGPVKYSTADLDIESGLDGVLVRGLGPRYQPS